LCHPGAILDANLFGILQDEVEEQGGAVGAVGIRGEMVQDQFKPMLKLSWKIYLVYQLAIVMF